MSSKNRRTISGGSSIRRIDRHAQLAQRPYPASANGGTTMTDPDNRYQQSDEMTRRAEFWLLSLAAVIFIALLAILINGFL